MLEIPLFQPVCLAELTKKQLVFELWPSSGQSLTAAYGEDISAMDVYFEFLSAQVRGGPRQEQLNTVRTYGELVFLVKILRDNASSTRSEIMAIIHNARPILARDATALSQSIQLAIRIWLMIDVRTVISSDLHCLPSFVPWPDNVTLPSALHSRPLASRRQSVAAKFSEYLNLHDMIKIAGFHVEWTDDLASHLSIKDSVVHIFHCVSALRKMSSSTSTSAFFDAEFFDETLATIDLLIPLSKPSSNGWLIKELKNKVGLDPRILYRNSARRDKAVYVYWHEKLSILEENFEGKKPRNMFQWWYDTRDMQQWWTFWLVVVGIVLTILFGLVQSVTGVIQVVYAARAN